MTFDPGLSTGKAGLAGLPTGRAAGAGLYSRPDRIEEFGPMAEDDALDAAVLRRLIAHLRERPDVQNIDLMNLAGFCRNCLSNWYEEAAIAAGKAVSRDEARERVYGMAYADWKAKYQIEARADQLAQFDQAKPKD